MYYSLSGNECGGDVLQLEQVAFLHILFVGVVCFGLDGIRWGCVEVRLEVGGLYMW